MTLQTYTILYLNLVSEMIYVVAERLKTQNVPIDKSKLGTYSLVYNYKSINYTNNRYILWNIKYL